MTAGLVLWLLALPEFAPWRPARFSLWGPGGWPAGAEMRRIGIAGGARYFFETFAFASLAQAAGLLGPTPLAAYTVLHNVEAMVFMIALGISVATAVRVGQAAGAGERRRGPLRRARRARRLDGDHRPARPAPARLRADGGRLLQLRPGLIARAAPLFAILAVSMVFDAGQVVLGQSTRALGDAWATTAVFFVAFWGVMMPAALILAFATPLAEAGLFIGTGIGCATAVALLLARAPAAARPDRADRHLA